MTCVKNRLPCGWWFWMKKTLPVHRWKGPWSLHFLAGFWVYPGLVNLETKKGLAINIFCVTFFLRHRSHIFLTGKPCPQSGSLGVLAKWPGKFWFWMNNSMFFSKGWYEGEAMAGAVKENPTLFWWIFRGEYLQLYVSFQIPLWVQRVCFGGKTCNLEV